MALTFNFFHMRYYVGMKQDTSHTNWTISIKHDNDVSNKHTIWMGNYTAPDCHHVLTPQEQVLSLRLVPFWKDYGLIIFSIVHKMQDYSLIFIKIQISRCKTVWHQTLLHFITLKTVSSLILQFAWEAPLIV